MEHKIAHRPESHKLTSGTQFVMFALLCCWTIFAPALTSTYSIRLFLRGFSTASSAAGAHCIDCGRAASIYAVQQAVFDDEIAHCDSCGGLVKPGEPVGVSSTLGLNGSCEP